MKKILLGVFLVLSFQVIAQQTEPQLKIVPDVHFRMFWMSTSYPKDFKNDYALGSSLNLGAKLTYSEHVNFHVGYRFYGNLWSSDLTSPDPLSGLGNRYEVGLFDLLHPEDKYFGKLETLSLSYIQDKWGAKVGRMGINTDWVNAQDGRLAPTAIEGLHAWYAPSPKWEFGLWAISKMGVRGTSEWLGIGESIGVFPVGRTINGEPSQYAGNTNSDWIGILEFSHQTEKFGKISVSETLVQNISNTLWASLEKNWPSQSDGKWFSGIQSGFQNGIGDGGNINPIFQYKDPEDTNWVVSAKAGYAVTNWSMSLSYSHLDGKGRWLSPREWGKDAWYTFIPRERNEGFGGMDALVAYVDFKIGDTGLRPYLHFGFHWLPDYTDPQANKYGFPSYRQLNLGLKYVPQSYKAIDFHLIIMNKEAIGNRDLSPKLRYNKVEMIHVNGMLNWRPFK
ncbi:hypothetical protein V8V91_06640 [Algoriphagus halophilus]|uniref:hypothetical protein n=1 Tax=Algoriphagus halophilus TaxID=226505 RepID=UPI00358EBD28